MVMVIMRMVVAMMVIMRVFVIMMVPVPMVVIMPMPMMVSMIVAVVVLMGVLMGVLMAVAQIVFQIVFIMGLRRSPGGTSASAAGFRLGRFLIGRMSLGGLRALHLLSGQGSGPRFTMVMPAAVCMIVVMMVTMVVLMCMFMMMPMPMPMLVLVLVLVLVVVLMPMVMPMFVVVLMRMRMPMMMLMFMAVAMIMSMVMSASTAMLAQALVVELVRHLQPLLIQQRQRARAIAGSGASRLDLLCRYAFSQQGQPLVEITMANAVDHQTRAGRRQRQRQSQLHQQVCCIAHQLFGLLGQHHQLGRVRQVETHRHMAGCHMLEPVGVSRGRHGLQPNVNATAASRGALRRLTACSPVRGLQQQAAGGRQGQQGLENAC